MDHAEINNMAVTQNNNEELILQSIGKAKSHLQFINSKYDAANIEFNSLNYEIDSMQVNESFLKDALATRCRSRDELTKECEKVISEIHDILWRKQVISLKIENEKNKRSYYENIMQNYRSEIADFLKVDEYPSKLEVEREKEMLITKIKVFSETIEEKKKINLISDENEIMQHIQKHPSGKLIMLKKSIQKIEMIIRNKEEELKGMPK